jgi:hypothetical protein
LSKVLPDKYSMIGRCLRKDPNRRFQTMADAKTPLEDLKYELQAAKAASWLG